MWHWGTWPSGHGGDGSKVGLHHDLSGLFQPYSFYMGMLLFRGGVAKDTDILCPRTPATTHPPQPKRLSLVVFQTHSCVFLLHPWFSETPLKTQTVPSESLLKVYVHWILHLKCCRGEWIRSWNTSTPKHPCDMHQKLLARLLHDNVNNKDVLALIWWLRPSRKDRALFAWSEVRYHWIFSNEAPV